MSCLFRPAVLLMLLLSKIYVGGFTWLALPPPPTVWCVLYNTQTKRPIRGRQTSATNRWQVLADPGHVSGRLIG